MSREADPSFHRSGPDSLPGSRPNASYAVEDPEVGGDMIENQPYREPTKNLATFVISTVFSLGGLVYLYKKIAGK